MLRMKLTLALAALALAVPATAIPALAQDGSDNPSAAQYEPPIPNAEASGEASSDESAADTGLESRVGFLPFTGLDLLVITGVALVLTGVGFALRRLSDPPPPLH
jgi:hypothetical protein